MKKIGKRFENTVADSVAEPIRAGDLKVARGPGVTRRSLAAAFASAVMALALLAGCGGAPAGDAGSDPAPEAQADTSASATGTLIVGFDQAYPPYGYVGDDGEYTGFDLDLAATFASLETIGEYNTAFMQLESGAVDAVACDLPIARYQMSAKPDAYLMLDEYLSEENYAVGFKKGDTATAKKVTEALKKLYEDGTVEQIAAKYADQGLTMDNWQIK